MIMKQNTEKKACKISVYVFLYRKASKFSNIFCSCYNRLATFAQEVPVYNLGRETSYPGGSGFSSFSSVPTAKFRKSTTARPPLFFIIRSN